MISWILLLILLISCVCAGALEVNVSQPLYQAEESNNVTMEWKFPPEPDRSTNSLFIECHLFTDHRVSVLYHLHEGIEFPGSQDEQFSGRVQCDRDVLREGRLRLHVSRLRTEDSGLYECEVMTKQGWGADECRLTVTATVAQEPHTTTTVSPEPESQKEWLVLLIALAGIVIVIMVIVVVILVMRQTTRPEIIAVITAVTLVVTGVVTGAVIKLYNNQL
ncbi:programmed cell death 1 ligand 1-like [Paralichthys olivaceus]|uniref:programmed cell death 1 ligand 1-like n=1 Tax=Paralichthys olivaceus TaxID=8255 RepID=UPI003753CC7D